jgi:hypothetical protein
MARKRRSKRSAKVARPWSLSLAEMAAAAPRDGGVGLSLLLFDAGFFERPQMKIVIRRVAA